MSNDDNIADTGPRARGPSGVKPRATVDKLLAKNTGSPFTAPPDFANLDSSAKLAELFRAPAPKSELKTHKWNPGPGSDNLIYDRLSVDAPLNLISITRSGAGKSFVLRWLIEMGMDAGVPIAIGDLDRDNPSLTARFGEANVIRPDNISKFAFDSTLERLHTFQVRMRCHVVTDVGFGSVRDFCEFAKRTRFQALQEKVVRPVLLIPLRPNLDDLLVLQSLDGVYLPRDVLLIPNESWIASPEDYEKDFAAVFADPLIRGLIARGAKTLRMPALPNGQAFQNTNAPFSWLLRNDWANPLNEFQQAGGEVFVQLFRERCLAHSNILPIVRKPSPE